MPMLLEKTREGSHSRLKVMTLLNEMVYNMYVLWCVKNDKRLGDAIRKLQVAQQSAKSVSFAFFLIGRIATVLLFKVLVNDVTF